MKMRLWGSCLALLVFSSLTGCGGSNPPPACRSGNCQTCPDGTIADVGKCAGGAACAAGTYVAQAGVCAACPSGSFSLGPDSASCVPWKVCVAGTYVANAPSATADRVCATCDSGTYTVMDNQSSCLAATDCPAGTVETTPAGGASEAVCTPCPAGQYCAGGKAAAVACPTDKWDNDGNAATACVAKTVCPAGTSVAAPGSATSDRACAPCSSGTFATTTNADRCYPWANCSAGSYVANIPSPVADRFCAPCAAGTYTSTDNQSACLTASDCPAGTEQTGSGSATSAPVCSACKKGQYCPGGATAAKACGNGTWDHDGNPATNCVSWTDCAAGSYVSSPGSATNDRECAACPQAVVSEGSFSASPNSATCAEWSRCAAGTYVMSLPTPTTDRKCASCPTGSYTILPNQNSCTTIGPCPAGTVQTSPGTATTPPVCAQCKVGQYCAGGTTPPVNCATGTWDGDRTPATACVPWTTCPAGSIEVAPGTASTDRVCRVADAVSCKELLAAHPEAVSGSYIIDPDREGPIAPMAMYCDMTTDGGGWTNLDFANNKVLLANGIFVSCTGGLTHSSSSIRCNYPRFDDDANRPLYHYRCDGNDNTANYILDFMAPLLGHRERTSLGFSGLSQQYVSSDGSYDNREYCYVGAYGDGAEVLWSDPACAAYTSNGNGNCIPDYFVLTIANE